MTLSVLDLFKIGIGPSSSHTVGPMWAAHRFVQGLKHSGQFERAARVLTELYGSLALTGIGHATDRAVLLGLQGQTPDRVNPEAVERILQGPRDRGRLLLGGEREVHFAEPRDLVFHGDVFLPEHPNGLRFTAFDELGAVVAARSFFSVGGGFVLDEDEVAGGGRGSMTSSISVPFPFASARDLLDLGKAQGLNFAEIVAENERAFRAEAHTDAQLDRIWDVMRDCIRRGCFQPGVLPGGLRIRRRAPDLFGRLHRASNGDIGTSAEDSLSPFPGASWADASAGDPLVVLDWVSLFALAVNEENAAGGRVVTAPTNGAAGVIPAVIGYYTTFVPGANAAGVRSFLLTAGAIGMLYKRNASLSAAEVGCQGEVGVACSMAAGGLCAVLGGANEQIENAAEIGMEHNLGLTCDPIGGLVQVPCIERNTMGAAKAINAARLAMRGDGSHHVSLDKVIETMRQTGHDMQSKYKETSLGGLAVNLVEC